MTDMINIRKAENSDRNDWIRMRKSLWPGCPADRHTLEMDMITSSPGIVLVAELPKSALVGFAEVSIRYDHVEGTTKTPVPYLEGLYLEPGHRRKGIGKALIEAAENFALQKGFNELANDAGIENEKSIDIHKSIGFKEVGRSVHFIRSL